MKKFLKDNWAILALIILTSLVVWPLFMPGYFPQHDNIQTIRIFEMRKCLTDGQIPCRWTPDMAFGNGYALFNFYGVAPYYIGALASFVLGYIGAAKFLYFLPLAFGGFGMYFLAKELFGKVPGFVAGVLFLFAPYRSVDAYVRGAIGESFGIALIPFVLYFLLKLIKTRKKKFFVLSSVFSAFFLISHNIMTMIFGPIIFLWAVFWLWKEKWQGLRSTIFSFVMALGLSAFFLFPAFFEKGLVQTEVLTRDYFDFRNHFAAVSQLFIDRFWGYGGSVGGIGDQLSFQIGWPHWWLVVGTLPLMLFAKKKNRFLAIGLFGIFALSVFMIHNRSSFIWEAIKILAYVQFPWRFLSIVIVSASLLGAYFVSEFGGKSQKIIMAIIVGLTIILNASYFRPSMFSYDLTDEKELTGEGLVNQQGGAVLDYLPKNVREPKELAPKAPYAIEGEVALKNFINKSNRWSFDANSQSQSLVEVPVLDFPKWEVSIDGNKIIHSVSESSGRIKISLPAGSHEVKGILRNTDIRTISNIVTLISILGLLVIYKYGKNSKFYS